MSQFATSLLVLLSLLSLAVLCSPTFGEESKREQLQLIQHAGESFHPSQFSSHLMSDFKLPSGSRTARQRIFFNLFSRFFSNFGAIPGQAQGASSSQCPSVCPVATSNTACPVAPSCPISTCPSCPRCPETPQCPTVTQPTRVSILSNLACFSEATAGTCTASSNAASGIVKVTWSADGCEAACPTTYAILTITAPAPYTKVYVICPVLPATVSVSTNTGTFTEFIAETRDTSIRMVISAQPLQTEALSIACSWTSLP